MTNPARRELPRNIEPFTLVNGRFVEVARGLVPLFQAEAAEGEKLRAPTAAAAEALKSSGLLTMLLPRRWGGAGISPSDYARAMIQLAKGDPSIAWVTQIINGTTWVGSITSDATQDALFGQGPRLICGAYNPPGIARRVEGGYIVTGAWPYTSGSRQADWAQCGVFIEQADGPPMPVLNMAYIPFSQIEMRDTWFVSGMQGTGSDTSVANEIFVPDARMVTMDKPVGSIEPGKRNWGAASDMLPVVPTVRATGLALLLGGAEAMLEIVEAESPKKAIVTTTYRHRTDSPIVLHDIGRIAAQLDSASILLFRATDIIGQLAEAGADMSDRQRSAHKAQCAQIVELIHHAIEGLMFIAGSSAFSLSHPLNRYWRDIHMGLRHITNIPSLGYEIYGRERLDARPNITPSGAF